MEVKEAIEVIKKNWPDSSFTMLREALETLVPELKESKGERIWIINYLNNRILNSTIIAEKENLKKAIAWLEKQGEKDMKEALRTEYEKGRADAIAEMQKEQAQEYLKGVDRVQNYEELTKFEKGFDRIADTYAHRKNKDGYNKPWYTKERAAEMLYWAKEELGIEQKSAWSEEDEEIYRKCICAMRASACGFPEEEKFVEQVDNWFKSLKDRVQPKQEWSEEDKAIIDYLLQLINNSHKEPCTKGLIAFGAEAWLKSLKDRYTWKPSDEQILALDEVYKTHGANNVCRRVLFNLMNDLKKLKE